MLKLFGYENKGYYPNWAEPPLVIDNVINSVTGTEPVTVEEAKNWALIDTSADDTVIETMLKSVRQSLETYLSADIVEKTRTHYIEKVNHKIELPFAPIEEITSITHSTDNTALTSSDYTELGLDNKTIDFKTYPYEHVKINYSTKGISSQSVKDAIKATFEYLYNSRGLVSMDNFKGFEIPETAKYLIAGHKSQFV